MTAERPDPIAEFKARTLYLAGQIDDYAIWLGEEFSANRTEEARQWCQRLAAQYHRAADEIRSALHNIKRDVS